LSGEQKGVRESALNNTKNTFSLLFINIGNILISVIAFLPRLFITFKDVINNSEKFVDNKAYIKENNFFKNILDVFGSNIPGSPKKSQVASQGGILQKGKNQVADLTNKVIGALESGTYNPGF